MDQDVVVLVDPVLTGQGFKRACRDRGLRVSSIYTLSPEWLTSIDPDYTAGDDATVHTSDLRTARELLPGPVRAVVPATEPSVHFADRLGASLDLAGNPVSTSLARRDKVAMRRRAVAGGVRVPEFAVVTDIAEVPAAADRVGYPAILKPPTGAGADGVVVLPDAPTARAQAAAHGRSRDVFGRPVLQWLVERYVRGPELAVNAFSAGGRHRVVDVWEYRQPGPGDYDQPYWDLAQLDTADPRWAVAAGFTHDVLDAFQVRLGPSHTEVKLTPDGPCLIELATRLPGAHITDHWAAHSAIRPHADTLASYLGEDPGILTADLGFDAALGICCIRNDDQPGTLQAVRGIDEVRRLPGVDAVHLNYRPGDHVPLTRDLQSVVALVLVARPDQDALQHTLTRIRQTVELELSW